MEKDGALWSDGGGGGGSNDNGLRRFLYILRSTYFFIKTLLGRTLNKGYRRSVPPLGGLHTLNKGYRRSVPPLGGLQTRPGVVDGRL